jgi:hypothetical protein
MNIQQANRILDEHKERQCHTLRTVNKALFICGDLREVDEFLLEIGERPCLESTNLVECSGTGQGHIRTVHRI